MQIVTMDWAPGSPFYTIVCGCDWQFYCSSNCLRVQCPKCGACANIHRLEREWIERERTREKEEENR